MIIHQSESDLGLDTHELQQMIDRFAKFDWLDEVILFGSRAKGTHREGSDIDLAIKGEKLTLAHHHELAEMLENLWLPYKFDIVLYEYIDEPALIDHIQRVGIKLYSK